FGRPSNYPPNSSWSRKHCYNNSLLKRRDINKPSIPAENLKRTTHTDNKSQYLDEDDDEEEDQLTAIVSRQRQAFSARAAAGRPSIRKIQSDLQVKSGDAVLSTVSSVPAARRLSAKVLRAWKSLAKKIICKVARQRGTNRRDKIILAKRAARECARLLRQKALLSQKAARDSISKCPFLISFLIKVYLKCINSVILSAFREILKIPWCINYGPNLNSQVFDYPIKTIHLSEQFCFLLVLYKTATFTCMKNSKSTKVVCESIITAK
ncbi:unnamed protein product, partial [Schistosoma curassoni]|uniref:DBINO domain-containing protein n=1 Tax=Schistosoma curassoni TaxID=6186 RepID=A0A183KJW4_9TREM